MRGLRDLSRTLIEAWASHQSFEPKRNQRRKDSEDNPGNPTVNFRGERQRNQKIHRQLRGVLDALARERTGSGSVDELPDEQRAQLKALGCF